MEVVKTFMYNLVVIHYLFRPIETIKPFIASFVYLILQPDRSLVILDIFLYLRSAMKVVNKLEKQSNGKGMGIKARNLLIARNHGFNVPMTYVLSFKTYENYVKNPKETLALIEKELSLLINEGTLYAVRSAADVEDGYSKTYAGQFETVVNVSGKSNIIKAMEKVWKSATDYRVQAYKEKFGNQSDICMSVIIQEMVDSEYSGIAFSKDPMTGFDEIIVEALAGECGQLTQSGITPERWIKKWGVWKYKPETPGVPESIIEEVCRTAKRAEEKFKMPVDIEWAWSRNTLMILQVRRIPEVTVPFYSNKISKEMLPGIIKPLIWSVNTSIINKQWADILKKLTGKVKIDPASLTGYFYCRAYFNMRTFGNIFRKLGIPKESLELLLGLDNQGPDKPKFKPGVSIISIIPHTTRFILGLISLSSRFNTLLPEMTSAFRYYDSLDLSAIPDDEIFYKTEILHGLVGKTAYYNILIPLLGAMFSKKLGKMVNSRNYSYDESIVLQDIDELDDYRPYKKLRELNAKYFGKSDNPVPYEQVMADKDFIDFISEFGHFSDSGNDFSYPPWRETPKTIYEMIRNSSEELKPNHNNDSAFPEDLAKKPAFRFYVKKVRKFSLNREKVSSLYTMGYGKFRLLFMELADRLRARGIIDHKEDIFYLDFNMVKKCFEKDSGFDAKEEVKRRKKEISEVEGKAVPDLVFGNSAPPLAVEKTKCINGVPTSHGFYTGPVKVLSGIKDIGKINEGDVIAIPYSDVGWTPLFSKAGAVISESGGILSHASIVAREFHIPAVVSARNVCAIKDGTIVSVNGFSGEVSISDSSGE